jgi:hypothetical protein
MPSIESHTLCRFCIPKPEWQLEVPTPARFTSAASALFRCAAAPTAFNQAMAIVQIRGTEGSGLLRCNRRFPHHVQPKRRKTP